MDDKAVFGLLDEEQEIRGQLVEDAPAIEFLLDLGDYITHFTIGLHFIRARLEEHIREGIDPDRLVAQLPEFRFMAFGIVAPALAVRDFLYNHSKALNVKERVDRLVDAWKRQPMVAMTLTLRNRVQHGAAMICSLNWERRTEHHPEGASVALRFDLAPAQWDSVLSDVSASIREECRSILADAAPAGAFLKIVEGFANALASLGDQIRKTLRDTHASSFADLELLLTRLSEIDSELAKHRVQDPMREARRLLEEIPRAKLLG